MPCSAKDFSTFAVHHGSPGLLVGVAVLIQLVSAAVALAVVAFVIRGAHERTTVPGALTETTRA